MLVKVSKNLVRMQRRFLSGGSKGDTNFAWLKWEDVCKPKKEDGLGVKDLRLVILALLSRWR